MLRHRLFVASFLILSPTIRAQEADSFTQPPISVPEGSTVELAAAPPLVKHPIMAGFDDRGRLYVAETAGINMQRKELEEKLPNYVLRLADTDGDGRFDQRTVFADKLTFPQGALWHDGWLYVASSGAIWRFADRDDDGVAEVREQIVGSFGYTGNAADVHGCFLGPEGRIWWCEGRHGHDIVDAAGNSVSKGKAARIFSCRSDGSDVQIHCGGGMDNPVEIDWTDEGEVLGTVNIFYHKRGDCLVHWMHGGVYPRHDQPQITGEFRKTGELLDAVHDYGHVAVSGCCRVRGAGFQPAAATFLVTEFNTHKVVQTSLARDGATFRADTSDFLQAASDDFHPTDVLEDADGSFLVIDTGGWFRIGCPTSQIAKPNILGAIYRVRRTDAPKIEDPRGLALEWNKLDATRLIGLLGDARPAVRERAIATLARQGEAAIPYLSRAILDKNPTIRRNAIWSLTRIGTPKAQGTVRLLGLADKDSSVLAAAVYSIGTTRDADATEDLVELLTESRTPPHIAREAATALGRISAESAAPVLLSAAGRDMDRVLEHAIIYALIEIADREQTTAALVDESPRIRRAALIALDQMPGGDLTRDQVAALLDTTDQPLLTAALDVISRREGWADELVTLAGKLLAQKELTESEESLLSGSLVGMARNEMVQDLIAQTLSDEKLSDARQSLLLDVIARSDLDPLPANWIEAIRGILDRPSLTERLVIQAIRVAGEKWSNDYERPLWSIVKERRPTALCRIAALGVLVAQKGKVGPSEFELLRAPLSRDDDPELRLEAARVLSVAPLSDVQLAVLTNDVAGARPLELKLLLAAYGRMTNPELVQQLVTSLSKASARDSLTEADWMPIIQRFPRDRTVLQLVTSLRPRPRLGDIQEVVTKLAAIEGNLPSGGVESGKLVFHGRKAACATCHRAGSEGGKIGPDLSKVGERRSDRDLLEAVIVPSASIARGYESQVIRTADGRTLTGLVVRETAESIYLRTSDQREVRLRRREIEEQKPSELSIMPAGLENTMSRQELADLLAYLRSLK